MEQGERQRCGYGSEWRKSGGGIGVVTASEPSRDTGANGAFCDSPPPQGNREELSDR